MEIKYHTSIIFVPNIKEIEAREDGFHEYFYFGVKKKNTKKIGQFLRAKISWTLELVQSASNLIWYAR